jgi:hypothetical protein
MLTMNLHCTQQKIDTWCAFSQCRVIGSIFFEETVTAECYQDILIQFIALLEADESNSCFQYDRAPCHTMGTSTALLQV